MRFSFVVPVYNVEEYLEQCVNSILDQDYPNYEIILIDDGSTDSSGVLCDKLAASDEKVRVIHQENGGASKARNTGIRYAQGEYILFVDSDDYIAPGILTKIDETISHNKSVDVLFLEAVKFWPDGREEPMGDGYVAERICGRTKDEVLEFLTVMPKFPGSGCTKAIRKALLMENSLFFEEGKTSEDIDWSYRLFGAAEMYAYLPEPYYYYRQARKGSVTNSVTAKKMEAMLWILEKWAQKKPVDTYRKCVNVFAAYEYMVLLLCLTALDTETAKPYWERAGKLKWILSFGRSKKLRLVNATVRLAGIKMTSRLLRLYKRR